MAHYKVVIFAFLTLFVSSAGAATGIRLITVKNGDFITVKGQRLQCIVTKANFNCTELGGWPRLSFHSSAEGGEKGKGEFFIFRQEEMVAQWFMLSQISRRK
jgi:hypothetical protein